MTTPTVRRRVAPTAATARVAIVHERFTEYAGSERVVAALAALWPDADVVAPVLDEAALRGGLEGRVTGGALSHLVRGGTYAHLLPVLPYAMGRQPTNGSDVVLASHHAFANSVALGTASPVVSYVHSPARWVWDPAMRAGEMGGRVGASLLAAYSAAYRSHDRRAAAAVHTLLANSSAVADRIERWWGREARVVHPPVDTEFYRPDPSVEREDFFLVAGRLVPYKRPQVAVQAAAAAGVPLVVAGAGRAEQECRRHDAAGIRFVGSVDDVAQRDLFRRCRALLMPGVEDFGILAVEAQACGAPVVAVGAGGALDTVDPHVSGELVDAPDDEVGAVAAWADALDGLRSMRLDDGRVRKHADAFSYAAFEDAMRDVVDAVLTGAAPSAAAA